ncbi:MAG: SIS domain-containing protein [Clostridia bacterium]|nr:SIS domain-containing protein [Clostridia bacterium]
MTRYPQLKVCEESILTAEKMMLDTYLKGGKILVCGNGGSAADADHIVGELMKGFLLRRKMSPLTAKKFEAALGSDAEEFIKKLQCGIPAISLPAQSAVLSAYANDVDAELMYSQLVFGYAMDEDMLIAISTSGNSKNVFAAAKVAKAIGIKTLALTGGADSKLSALCDCTVKVPESETFKIQELHLPVYHYLCASVERTLFNTRDDNQ